mmetsp:Transcript_1848/g.4163  ORF Transcript_1848/g.4163 Transcript_1848/m.4163 type:complete len:263 (-) Transcript_1848:301-1089(-)
MGLSPDSQVNLPATLRDEVVIQRNVLASNQGEEIGRLREGVHPNSVVTTALQATLGNQVPVRKQNRVLFRIGDYLHSESGHNVRPVWVVGDATEALSLTLSAEVAPRLVQATEGGVVLGFDVRDASKSEGFGWRVVDEKAVLVHFVVLTLSQTLAVDVQSLQTQVLAVEEEGNGSTRFARNLINRVYCRLFLSELELQVDLAKCIRVLLVVLQVHSSRLCIVTLRLFRRRFGGTRSYAHGSRPLVVRCVVDPVVPSRVASAG